jgi:hypothetical protein
LKPASLFALALATTCALTGCDNFDFVDKSKDAVIPKSELQQLTLEAADAKQVGRYQLHRDGNRTWRLDTSTGHSCLLLASEWDWKTEAANQNSCANEDVAEARKRHRLHPSLYDQNGEPIIQAQTPATK